MSLASRMSPAVATMGAEWSLAPSALPWHIVDRSPAFSLTVWALMWVLDRFYIFLNVLSARYRFYLVEPSATA